MAIVVIGAVFVDIKGFPEDIYLPTGRNAGNVEFVHGGVGRNVVEDIANLELRPRFVSMVDNTAQGEEVVRKLKNHKVDTEYVLSVPGGMGIWLAVFDNTGDLAGSISRRPNPVPLVKMLEEKGDEIFADCDSIILEIDLDKEVAKRVFKFAEKYNKPVYGVVANIAIASERRDLLRNLDCFVCNVGEAGLLFAANFDELSPEALADEIAQRISNAGIRSMVVTMGGRGSVYACENGEKGVFPAEKVQVRDTTGAGDAFCAGVSVGRTYGLDMRKSVEIGTRLAASVITSSDNVCPRFMPRELGLDIDVTDA